LPQAGPGLYALTQPADEMSKSERPNPLFRNLNAKVASIPMILTASVVFVGGTVWTVLYSFTNSKLLPRLNFVGLDQYYGCGRRRAGWSRSRTF